MKSYHVIIWNGMVQRGYTILAETSNQARIKAIKAELERGVPRCCIQIEKVELW